MAKKIDEDYLAAVRAQALGDERKPEAEWIANNNLLVHQDSRKFRKSKAVALDKFTNTLTTVYPTLVIALGKSPNLDPEEEAFKLFEQTRLGMLLQSNNNKNRDTIYQKITTEITTNKSLNTKWRVELDMIKMVVTYANNYKMLTAAAMEDDDKVDTEKECTVREIFNVMGYILDKPETQYAQGIFDLYPAYKLAYKRETVTTSDDATYQQEMAAVRRMIKQDTEETSSINGGQSALGWNGVDGAGDEDDKDL